jgi:hypothetical protein
MNGGAPLDGRREKALRAEMLRRAAAVLAGDGQERPAGEIARAIIGVAARIEEEVTRRLDRVPDKQTDNFFNAMGIGRDPARPAQVPVAFTLADAAPDGLVAPASTRLMASGEAGSVVFETGRAIALAPGSIAALVGVDAGEDEIFLPPEGVVDARLPREPAVERSLTSGAGANTDKLQISLVTGLAIGTVLAIGPGAGASQHTIMALEGDLVTVKPPLDHILEAGTPVSVVTDFAPFAGHRNRQSHALYLGHETLLNLPSALSFTVTGVQLPEGAVWSWWGETDDDPPGWQELVPTANAGRLTLKKEAGQPLKTEIRGRETLWLRARLPGPSQGPIEARDIRLSVAGEGVCSREHTERCSEAYGPMKVDFEAIANTTPIVLNSAFHPFGREPRLFDSFYVGCAEAFSKPGAEASLCFKFAGPELGPLAAVSQEAVTQFFGVGKDGLLYRAQLGKDQPQLISIVPSRDDLGGTALNPQAPVAARLDGKTVFVAIGGKGAVHLAQIPFEGPLEGVSLKWKRLVGEAGGDARIVRIAFVPETSLMLYAETDKGVLLTWSNAAGDPKAEPATGPESRLVPLQGAGGALLIDKQGKADIKRPSSGASGTSRAPDMPAAIALDAARNWVELAAWADQSGGIVLAGYEGSTLKVGRILPAEPAEPIQLQLNRPEGAAALPITFEPPPRRARNIGADGNEDEKDNPADDPPTLLLASATPERFVWDGENYLPTSDPSSIGNSGYRHRRFVIAPGWIAVQRAEPGLLYRRATRDGRWAEEFVIRVKGPPLALASDVPFASQFASPDLGPKRFGFDLVMSAKPGLRLLRPMAGAAGDAAVSGTASFYHASATPDGAVEKAGDGLSLVNVDAKAKANAATAELEKAKTRLKAAEADAPIKRQSQSDKALAASNAKTAFERELLKFEDLTKKATDAETDLASAKATLADRTTESEDAQDEHGNLVSALKALPPPAPAATTAAATTAAGTTATGATAAGTTAAGATAAGTEGAGTAATDPTATGTGVAGAGDGGATPAPPPAPQPDPAEVSLKAQISAALQRVNRAEERKKAAQAEVTRLQTAATGAAQAATGAGKTLETARTAQGTTAAALIAATSAVEAADRELADARAAKAAAEALVKDIPSVVAVVSGDEAGILLFDDGKPAGLWRLTRASDGNWRRPQGFPPVGKLRYRLLDLDRQLPVIAAVEITNPAGLQQRIAELEQLGEAGKLHSRGDSRIVVSAVEEFDKTAVIAYSAAPGAGRSASALLTTSIDDWSALGPSQPPNPALSWEYWNGQSWWALDDTGLLDRTANLLVDGGVFFVVPPDLEETEVSGRKNHWIRARLVGGDYGEAQVTVKSTTVGGEARQTVERDMTTIRAPYVTSLQLGFCARTEVAPEIVLTEDSLGVVDQTSANIAGLPVAVFTPVADVMNPRPPELPEFRRGLMIGFEKPVRGDPVSLYVDAAPGGVANELTAEILRNGRFQTVGVRDETQGLTEPGMIQLSLNAVPDQADLFGAAAYWVRLRPNRDASRWSPRIRGIHLNAVRAHSVETREMESLGHSSGIPDQGFRLAEAPVAPESLELRVREALGEEDILTRGLDVLTAIGSMPGPWVRWEEVDDLGETGGAGRGFLLDAETGLVRFGDGRQGAIPPLGGELLAVRYRHVAGTAGNAVAAGAALQPLSPLTGVERVSALDAAAGGSDVETAADARRRASTKMRHGDRILTLADLEDYVRARSPTVAQVRAANRGGSVRLVVAVRGAEPRPAPAVLRALESAVRATAGFGVARAGGLSVVAPRLLPLRVTMTLEPDDPDRLIEMADAVEAALVALFDPAAGGFDGQGWPIGRLPIPADVSAALEPVAGLGVVSDIALWRAGRGRAEPLPPSLPADMLVRLDPNEIVAERRREAAA